LRCGSGNGKQSEKDYQFHVEWKRLICARKEIASE